MATSQNGYTAASSTAGIPSGTVRVGADNSKARFTVRKDVADAFRYLLNQFHTRVESIDLYTKPGGDDWGYAARPIRGSSTTLSNHASATAVDINATRHPLGVGGNMGFTSKQITEIRQILREMKGIFRWGGDYSGRKDGMHFELNKPKAEVLRVMAGLRDADAPVVPAQPLHRPLISMSAVRKALAAEAELAAGLDGEQYQWALNRFHAAPGGLDYVLDTDGVLGAKSRRSTALAQLDIAKRNGNTTLTKADCWPDAGFNSDLDGIPGAETTKALGIDDSDN